MFYNHINLLLMKFSDRVVRGEWYLVCNFNPLRRNQSFLQYYCVPGTAVLAQCELAHVSSTATRRAWFCLQWHIFAKQGRYILRSMLVGLLDGWEYYVGGGWNELIIVVLIFFWRRYGYIILYLVQNWTTSAVSATDWMVEAQLCKLRVTSIFRL